MNSRNGLRIAARTVLIVSVATQLLTVGYFWWKVDSQMSCGGFLYWDEWARCLHGRSYTYVKLSELLVGVWLIAGLATLLGRYVWAYVSVLLPLVLGIGAMWL